MGRYLIQDTTSKAIKKSLLKWGELSINDAGIRGVITIKNHRKYQFRDEIDIEFKGEVFARLDVVNRQWHGSDIMLNKSYNVSKIKLNRYIRKNIFREIKIRMNYFGVDMKDYRNIVKIKWV